MLNNTMDINTLQNSIIKFSFPDNGYKIQQETAAKYLTINETYTVDKIIIDNSTTDVYLKEIKDIPFNSVLFSNI